MSRMQSPTSGLEQMTTVTQFNLKSVMYQNMGMLSYSRDVANDRYYSILENKLIDRIRLYNLRRLERVGCK